MNTKDQTTKLIQRPLTLDDLDAALKLIHTWENHHIGKSVMSRENLQGQWSNPDYNLATSSQALYTPEGEMVALVNLYDADKQPIRPRIYFRTHPNYEDPEKINELLQWARQTAPRVLDRVPEDLRVVLESSALRGDPFSENALAAAGLIGMDQDWNTMVIHLDAEPAPVEWPAGYRLTTQAEFQDLRAVYEAEHIIFQDHRGSTPEETTDDGFQAFKQRIEKNPCTDTSMWFLAMCDGEIAGMVLCDPEKPNNPERGYILVLGVKREHRHKGLGEKLLQHSFRAFWQRGKREADLIVDGSSLTGANRLYERGGMQIEYGYQTFELELRPGRELTNQG